MGDAPGPAPSQAPAAAAPKTSGKYVPPSLRDGVNKGRGETMSSKRGLYFLPALPKAKAGLGVQSLRPSVRPSVRPSQNLVITTPLKLLIQLSCNLVCR